eukprot:6169448-Pyramimonas_sp.AAC.1
MCNLSGCPRCFSGPLGRYIRGLTWGRWVPQGLPWAVSGRAFSRATPALRGAALGVIGASWPVLGPPTTS